MIVFVRSSSLSHFTIAVLITPVDFSVLVADLIEHRTIAASVVDAVQLVQFCLCFGRELCDLITDISRQPVEPDLRMALGQFSDSCVELFLEI